MDTTQVSNPQAVITFFSACVTAYAIIIGLSNIYSVHKKDITGMEHIKNYLLLFSVLFLAIFFVVLFVPPTPFESVTLIAKILFLVAVAVTIYITELILK